MEEGKGEVPSNANNKSLECFSKRQYYNGKREGDVPNNANNNSLNALNELRFEQAAFLVKTYDMTYCISLTSVWCTIAITKSALAERS